MTRVNVYLTFDGQCEEAFEHYRSVFGGDFASIARFGEMPESDDFSVPDGFRDRLMHVTLPIGGDTVVMGSDTIPGMGPPLTVGNNFSISVAPDSRAEADRIVGALAEGGRLTMPMADQFWGAYFGMCTDRFGINWMVNFDTQQAG